MDIFEKGNKKLVYWQLLLVANIILVPLLVYVVVVQNYSPLFLITLIIMQIASLSIVYKFSSIWDQLLEYQHILDKKERDLKESDKNLKAFFDGSQDSIIILSPERKVITFNKMAANGNKTTSSIPLEKLMLLDDLVPTKEKLTRFKYNFEKALAGEKIKTIRQSGNIWNAYQYIPIYDNNGHIWAVALTITDVTKEKLHENELTKSEEMYRQILNAVEDQILVKKEGSKYVWANQAFHDFYQMSLKNFSKFTEEMFDDQEFEERYKADDEQIFKTGEHIKMTEVTKDAKQEEQIFQTVKSPIIDAAGKVQMIVSVGRNITDQFKKEVELRKAATESQNLFKQLMKSKDELAENEKRLRLLADNSIEMITLCSPEGEMLYLSPSTERLTGYKREELYNKNFTKFFHPDDTNSILTQAKIQGREQEKQINFTHRFLTKAGDYRWFSSILKYVYDEDGDVISLQTSSRDSTDMVLAEISLKSSEARFRELFNSGYDGIFIFEIVQNKYLKLVEVNKIICKMLGYSSEEVPQLKSDIIQIEKGLDGEKLKERVAILQRDNFFTCQTTFITKLGKEIPVEVVATLFKYEDKEMVQAVARDITERNKTAQAVKDKEFAEHSLKVKSDFLANMSHEIRTPMNGIIGVAHLLANTTLSPQQGILVKTINESGKNMLNILNDVLTLSKLESDKITLSQKTFDFQHTITNIRQLFLPLLLQKKLLLLTQIDELIPRYIIADATKLSQVLTNLLSNAAKFTEKGRIIIDAEVISETHETDFVLKISISDTGKGISEANQKHLFEKFYQVEEDTNTKNNEGTGLGLSICKGLVTLWGGEIGVESSSEGSKFWFTIPVKAGDGASLQNAGSRKGLANLALKFDNLTILLVEDKKINQEVARMMLENIGCTVTLAENGLEGFNLAKDNFYDLVLMDIFMPIMDGITATQKIKKEIQQPPIIIGLSANAMEEDSKRYIKQGMDDYLSKPIDLYILSEKIAKWFPEKVATEKFTNNYLEKKATNEKEIIQVEVVERIRSLAKNNIPYLQNLYQSLADDMEILIRESYEALKNEDNTLITRNIHTIKGLSGTIGMTKLQECTSSLYIKLKANNFENLKPQLQEIEKAHLQSLPLLRQALGL